MHLASLAFVRAQIAVAKRLPSMATVLARRWPRATLKCLATSGALTICDQAKPCSTARNLLFNEFESPCLHQRTLRQSTASGAHLPRYRVIGVGATAVLRDHVGIVIFVRSNGDAAGAEELLGGKNVHSGRDWPVAVGE